MSDYNLDVNAAKQADVKFSSIDKSGQYAGHFTRAEKITSEKGTKGVDLSFKSDCGAQADYLTLWTHDKDGKQLASYKTLNAIMTALRVKTMTATTGTVEKYVKDKGRQKVEVQLFTELMNKPIILIIQMEESEYNGKVSWKPLIYGVADENGFTASEILTQAKSAEVLHKMLSGLKDKFMKNAPAQQQQHQNHSENPGAGMSDAFDEDIPF